jgi:hypothetical protein
MKLFWVSSTLGAVSDISHQLLADFYHYTGKYFSLSDRYGKASDPMVRVQGY